MFSPGSSNNFTLFHKHKPSSLRTLALERKPLRTLNSDSIQQASIMGLAIGVFQHSLPTPPLDKQGASSVATQASPSEESMRWRASPLKRSLWEVTTLVCSLRTVAASPLALQHSDKSARAPTSPLLSHASLLFPNVSLRSFWVGMGCFFGSEEPLFPCRQDSHFMNKGVSFCRAVIIFSRSKHPNTAPFLFTFEQIHELTLMHRLTNRWNVDMRTSCFWGSAAPSTRVASTKTAALVSPTSTPTEQARMGTFCCSDQHEWKPAVVCTFAPLLAPADTRLWWIARASCSCGVATTAANAARHYGNTRCCTALWCVCHTTRSAGRPCPPICRAPLPPWASPPPTRSLCLTTATCMCVVACVYAPLSPSPVSPFFANFASSLVRLPSGSEPILPVPSS
eukprot:m.99114 g.99114  ORF g.99114 m.99114 type:complete len:396 (+) comp14026_c1_seq2:247-1434(+)